MSHLATVDAKGGEKSKEQELLEERYPSVVPLLPPLTDKTIKFYLRFYLSALGFIIVFGGLLAPTLEVKLGLGGEVEPPSSVITDQPGLGLNVDTMMGGCA